ncbi:MAG TPA: 3-hydroxyacyl-CoA dehydrogenase family protein [Candidatus Thalassarchaeaceae archaeon]|nr:3-hydroxyacyl-CoA dehydrogenase family protein [Candidatus Thalassarchaeaceae archaeon]
MAVSKVAVIGAGTMGSGIAQVSAQAGLETRLFDNMTNALANGKERIEVFWEKGIARGKTTPEQKLAWSKNLAYTESLAEAVDGVDLVVEAVPERKDLKISVFQDLVANSPTHAILATNTSGLKISEIAAATDCPERVIGMHFFNPVPLMPLLEIVCHEGVSEKTLEIAKRVADSMGKTSIIVRDVPGFATSRLGVVLGNEAIRMLDEGVASASDIDAAMRLGYGHPMGPLELSDLVGLDVRRDILNNLVEAFGDESYRPHSLLEQLVDSGELGKKSGLGIYDWTGGDKAERPGLGLSRD